LLHRSILFKSTKTIFGDMLLSILLYRVWKRFVNMVSYIPRSRLSLPKFKLADSTGLELLVDYVVIEDQVIQVSTTTETLQTAQLFFQHLLLNRPDKG
jgi:hypothetical protein